VSWERIWALNLRQLFLMRRSFARITDLFYWPLLDLFFYGFLSLYLGTAGRVPLLAGVLLGALILWDLFFRVQQAISVSFLTELWTRNLINIFVTPVTLTEFVVAMMLWGLIKIAITATLMAAVAFVLYHFNIFVLGVSLVPLVTSLIVFAWAVGTAITAVILRYGQSAETLAWSLAFLFQPFGAVFFPLSVYPVWLRQVLLIFPLPYIFEGMRAVLAGQSLSSTQLAWAFGLDALYLLAAFAFFAFMFSLARRRGLLLKLQD
jgi:ABC-2 type transport system permease protein